MVGIALLFLLVCIEVGLRMTGVKPGYTGQGGWFQEVDSLYLFPEYIADENGILKLSESARSLVSNKLSDASKLTAKDVFNFKAEPSVEKLITDFGKLNNKVSYQNEFNEWIEELGKKPPHELSPVDSACLKYADNPINPSGFKSIEFQRFDSTKKSILLLGDSFTWGASAEPLTASFADILLARGYVVYNTGIITADPAQYESLAQQYIPFLQPDVVVVNFYMGNDIVWWERELQPHQFPYYPTNAGWLWADPRREYFTNPNTLYDYIKSQSTIPFQQNSWFNRFCASTALGTKLWLTLSSLELIQSKDVQFEDYEKRNSNVWAPSPVSENHIARIREMAEKNGAAFLFMVIPDMRIENVNNAKFTPDSLFKKTPYYVPPTLKVSDYRPLPDAHFNNSGHLKFANYLDSLIQK